MVYLLFFVSAVIGALIPPGLTGPVAPPTDAGAVAAKITANKTGYELEIAFGLMSTALYVALIALLYRLLREVGRTPAVLMLAFGLMGSAVTAVENLMQVMPVVVLNGDSYLSVYSSQELQALALLFLHVARAAAGVALVFFGVFQLALGWLVYRSGFIPGIIGAVVAIAGIGWLTYLFPPMSTLIATPLAVLGAGAELSLMFWLLVFGVRPATRAGASSEPARSPA